MLKLRTMQADADFDSGEGEVSGEVFVSKTRYDLRVSRIGRLLRRSSIDELPQLLNVLAGQMSLVGPRPSLPQEVARYPHSWRRRLAVKPGLTGLWQVSGRSEVAPSRRMAMDRHYIRHRSLAADCLILLRTVFCHHFNARCLVGLMRDAIPAGFRRVSFVHDYMTQLGGAERVAGILASNLSSASLMTSVHRPEVVPVATIGGRPWKTSLLQPYASHVPLKVMLPALPRAVASTRCCGKRSSHLKLQRLWTPRSPLSGRQACLLLLHARPLPLESSRLLSRPIRAEETRLTAAPEAAPSRYRIGSASH